MKDLLGFNVNICRIWLKLDGSYRHYLPKKHGPHGSDTLRMPYRERFGPYRPMVVRFISIYGTIDGEEERNKPKGSKDEVH